MFFCLCLQIYGLSLEKNLFDNFKLSVLTKLYKQKTSTKRQTNTSLNKNHKDNPSDARVKNDTNCEINFAKQTRLPYRTGRISRGNTVRAVLNPAVRRTFCVSRAQDDHCAQFGSQLIVFNSPVLYCNSFNYAHVTALMAAS